MVHHRTDFMRTTVSTKINFIAAYYFLLGGFLIILAVAALVVPVSATLMGTSEVLARMPGWFLGIVLLLAAGTLAVLGIACLAIGWGLWQVRPWARQWAMIAGVVQIPLLPIGTLAGGASLYLLLQDSTRDLFLG